MPVTHGQLKSESATPQGVSTSPESKIPTTADPTTDTSGHPECATGVHPPDMPTEVLTLPSIWPSLPRMAQDLILNAIRLTAR